LNGFLVVDFSTVWAGALVVGVLKTVEAELADLIATRTWLEVLVSEVEFLNAERTSKISGQ
jgi:hypothetical protein